MEKIVLTPDELRALQALIDGDRRQHPIPPKIRERLSELRLIERREWPSGPPWLTARGTRVVRESLRCAQ